MGRASDSTELKVPSRPQCRDNNDSDSVQERPTAQALQNRTRAFEKPSDPRCPFTSLESLFLSWATGGDGMWFKSLESKEWCGSEEKALAQAEWSQGQGFSLERPSGGGEGVCRQIRNSETQGKGLSGRASCKPSLSKHFQDTCQVQNTADQMNSKKVQMP